MSIHKCRFGPPIDDAKLITDLVTLVQQHGRSHHGVDFPYQQEDVRLISRFFGTTNALFDARQKFESWIASTIVPMQTEGTFQKETDKILKSCGKLKRGRKRIRTIRRRKPRKLAPTRAVDHEPAELLFDGEPPSGESWDFGDEESDDTARRMYISQLNAFR